MPGNACADVVFRWCCPEEGASAMKALIGFFRDERGTETLEWGLVCGLIVIGAIVAIASIGPKVTAMWNNVDAAIK